MKRFIQGDHRGQSTLLPESLDDYVSAAPLHRQANRSFAPAFKPHNRLWAVVFIERHAAFHGLQCSLVAGRLSECKTPGGDLQCWRCEAMNKALFKERTSLLFYHY